MAQFRPYIGLYLVIRERRFEFVAHPLFPHDSDALYVLEGGESLVYQIRSVLTGQLYALKVTKPAYRSEHILHVDEVINRSTHIPGFYLHDRLCLTTRNCPDLLKAYPDLEYAVLMPWLEGKTWSGLLLDQAASASYTLPQALVLASTLANILRNLESLHLAHADIAGGNVFLSPDLKRVQLLDLEGMYIPDVTPPPFRSQGSPGYQRHRPGPEGNCCPEGDRFAGAILLAEMLTWWSPRVRACVADHASTLFQSTELQTDSSPCWAEARIALWSFSPALLHLFDKAWSSTSLAECPDFATWAKTFFSLAR